jgi:hypothetical protein
MAEVWTIPTCERGKSHKSLYYGRNSALRLGSAPKGQPIAVSTARPHNSIVPFHTAPAGYAV